jgi:hypothetical protein
MPVLIILYVSSCFCTSWNPLWGLKFYLLHLVSLACCTNNLIVLLPFHVLSIGPAFLGLHICILYITAETAVGHYIRTEIYLYVSPKYPHCNVWCIHYHYVSLSFWQPQWPCGLMRRSVAAHCWDREVRIPLRAWMFVSCVCFVLCI